MSGLIGLLTGSNMDAARRQQEQALQEQAVSQARQLQTEATDTAKTALIRRDPRGRRLLADASISQLPTTVG